MIGYANNPFAPYYFITNRYFDRIQPTASTQSEIIEDESPIVGAISPKTPQDDAAAALCILPKQVALRGPNITLEMIAEAEAQVFNFSPLRWPNDRWSFAQVEVCSPNSSELTYGYGAGYSQIFQCKGMSLLLNDRVNVLCVIRQIL